MDSRSDELLSDIDRRLAHVEERVKDLREIKAELKKIDDRLLLLTYRVAGTAGGVAIIVSIAAAVLSNILLK